MSFFAAQPRLLVPVTDHADLFRVIEVAAAFGRARSAEITVLDVVEVPSDVDLSAAATAARAARVRLEELVSALHHRVHPVVRIDRSRADGVLAAVKEGGIDLVVAGRSSGSTVAHRRSKASVDDIVRTMTAAGECHVALLRLGPTDQPDRVLVAVRGGPHAELALATAGAIATGWGLPVTVLHVMPPGLTRHARHESERSLQALARQHVPGDVVRVVREATDVVVAIGDESADGDLLMLGASLVESTGADGSQSTNLGPDASSLGEVPDRLVREARGSVMVLRTRDAVPADTFEALESRPGTLPALDRAAEELRAIPRRVDRWFGELNYHHREFADLRRLVELKEQQRLTVSLVLPALNEEATIGPIVRRAREELVDRHALVDDLLVIDSASVDGTREIAAAEGARVVQHPDVLPQYGTLRGKGEALWKSLYETTGDLVAWADTDVRDWHPRMVYGTLGPLIVEPRIQYVKGYYQRPIVEGGVLKEGGGGRVTELVARPLINLLYPELSGFIQPLSGEYAGRRSLLESIPFFTGYAVEIGHLIDIYERVGLDGLGQVDLERRVHRNQELEGLSKMSFVILQAVLTRLETGRRASLFAELGSRMKLPRSSSTELFLEVIELSDQERPPMDQIPEYATRPKG